MTIIGIYSLRVEYYGIFLSIYAILLPRYLRDIKGHKKPEHMFARAVKNCCFFHRARKTVHSRQLKPLLEHRRVREGHGATEKSSKHLLLCSGIRTYRLKR